MHYAWFFRCVFRVGTSRAVPGGLESIRPSGTKRLGFVLSRGDSIGSRRAGAGLRRRSVVGRAVAGFAVAFLAGQFAAVGPGRARFTLFRFRVLLVPSSES